jgi:argininosuccinate lyase
MTGKKPWQGRFAAPTDQALENFSESLSFDYRLYPQDIKQSLAHCEMLIRQEIIPERIGRKIIDTLSEIKVELDAGTLDLDPSKEDVHMAIEACLIEKMGPEGGALHTARSRNDQVATDLRLYVKEEVKAFRGLLKKLMSAFVERAREHIDLIFPGLTHLQHAQAVRFSHHLMAYVEMFHRDEERLTDALKRMDLCPLGSGALAGTTFPIDREFVAEKLGFTGVTRNSMDAVSDRDFVVEFLAVLSLIMVHLSRFAEDLILWNSAYWHLVELPDALATGSSMMPQKKNPDGAELIRGKSGRVFGHLMALLTLLKGLPMTYNRDLQEDKEPLFDAVDTVRGCLRMATLLVKGLKLLPEEMKKAAGRGYLQATDLTDYLVRKGHPFRQAHEIVGRLVSYAVAGGKDLSEISFEEMRQFSADFGEDVFEVLSIEMGVDQRKGTGMTGRDAVMTHIAYAEKNYLKGNTEG